MPDPDRQLVAKLAHGGSIGEVLSRGIDGHHFAEESCREVFEFVREHTISYRTQPSFRAVREHFPDYHFEIVEEPLAYILDEFTAAVKRRFAIERIYDLAEAIDDKTKWPQIDELFLEASRDLSQIVPTPKVARFSDMKIRYQRYMASIATGEVPMGIQTGIPTIDNLTFGIQPHEFVSIVGWQGSGKSSLLGMILFQAYIRGKTPLVFSLEMEAEALLRRWDAMAAKLRYKALRGLELSDEELERWEGWCERVEHAAEDIIIIDDLGSFTVDRVFAETVRYKPDVIGLDYISLMDAPTQYRSVWEQIGYLSKNLKRISRNLKVPILAVAQTNIAGATEGAKLENIGFSRSIGADSDISLGLYQNEEMQKNRQMELRLNKNRDGPTTTVNLYWDQECKVFEEWTTAHEIRLLATTREERDES